MELILIDSLDLTVSENIGVKLCTFGIYCNLSEIFVKILLQRLQMRKILFIKLQITSDVRNKMLCLKINAGEKSILSINSIN